MEIMYIKRIGLAVAAVLVGFSSANAQMADDMIARAILAAPARAQADAMVVTWDADGNREVLREGANGWVCWDRSGQNGQRAFAVQCTNEGNLARYEQKLAFFRATDSREAANALMDTAEADGTREVAVFGSAYYNFSGTDQESARAHMTIAVPFATAESLGLPSERMGAVVYIMSSGTSGAHIMVPGRQRKRSSSPG